MAHNISRLNGTYQAWYGDNRPAWHGLGKVTAGAKTAAQVTRTVPAFRQPVILVPVGIKVGGRWIEQDGDKATVRKGSTARMGYVTDTYQELTDGDALETLEAIITVAGDKGAKAAFGSAGLLGARGQRGFASIDLTRVFGDMLKVKRDPSKQQCWLFGDWTHDGTAAMHAGCWRNRVDCNNMLNMALADAEAQGMLVTIRHTGDMQAKIRDAQQTLGLAELTIKADAALMQQLVETPIKPKWLDGFAEYVVTMPGDDQLEKRGRQAREDARDLILGLYRNADDLVKLPQSAYRAHQAAVDYADHHRPLRIRADEDLAVAADRRFRSITEGPAADLKARSLDYIRQSLLVGSAN